MNRNGRSQVGAFVPDNLIAGNRHPVDTCLVIIKEGQKLGRGAVLTEDADEKGKYVILGTNSKETEAAESSENSSSAEYILAEAVDASEEDMTGAAYRTGEFAENSLIVAEGYQITDNDRKALRNAGIFLSTIMM